MTIRWHKLFTRQNLGRFSKEVSAAVFLGLLLPGAGQKALFLMGPGRG